MTDYKSMYYHLAGRISGTIEALETIVENLKLAQLTTEEMFMSSDDSPADFDLCEK
jgi:hypothetical protein